MSVVLIMSCMKLHFWEELLNLNKTKKISGTNTFLEILSAEESQIFILRMTSLHLSFKKSHLEKILLERTLSLNRCRTTLKELMSQLPSWTNKLGHKTQLTVSNKIQGLGRIGSSTTILNVVMSNTSFQRWIFLISASLADVGSTCLWVSFIFK